MTPPPLTPSFKSKGLLSLPGFTTDLQRKCWVQAMLTPLKKPGEAGAEGWGGHGNKYTPSTDDRCWGPLYRSKQPQTGTPTTSPRDLQRALDTPPLLGSKNATWPRLLWIPAVSSMLPVCNIVVHCPSFFGPRAFPRVSVLRPCAPIFTHQEGPKATSVQAWCRQRRCRRWARGYLKTGRRVVARRVTRPCTRRSCNWRCRREVSTVSWMRLSSRGLWTDTREFLFAFEAFPFASAAPPPLSSHTWCAGVFPPLSLISATIFEFVQSRTILFPIRVEIFLLVFRWPVSLVRLSAFCFIVIN